MISFVVVSVVSLAVGFFANKLLLKTGLADKFIKPTPSVCGPDTLDAYRIMAAIRDTHKIESVSVFTENYSTNYPAEFATKKVAVVTNFSGYFYEIQNR